MVVEAQVAKHLRQTLPTMIDDANQRPIGATMSIMDRVKNLAATSKIPEITERTIRALRAGILAVTSVKAAPNTAPSSE